MALSFHFDLTAAQSALLTVCAFGHYTRAEGNKDAPLMPNYSSTFFLNTAKCLLRKGLLSHDPKREPSWQATREGSSVALLITSAARTIVHRFDTAKPIPTATAPKKSTRTKTISSR